MSVPVYYSLTSGSEIKLGSSSDTWNLLKKMTFMYIVFISALLETPEAFMFLNPMLWPTLFCT